MRIVEDGKRVAPSGRSRDHIGWSGIGHAEFKNRGPAITRRGAWTNMDGLWTEAALAKSVIVKTVR